jgi:hypothetical protein
VKADAYFRQRQPQANRRSKPDNLTMRSYYFIRRWLSVCKDEFFGLDASNVAIANVPVIVREPKNVKLTRDLIRNANLDRIEIIENKL